MSEIKDKLASNIAELRKINNMTQSELAEKLNYTDKAISKWERGESTPDIESLCSIAEIFGLTVDQLLHENYSKEKTIRAEKIQKGKAYAKYSLIVLTIWLIGTVVFVYDVIRGSGTNSVWLSFIWPVPTSFLYLTSVAFFKKYKKALPFFASSLLWTFLGAVYLQMLVLGENVWIIFTIGVPLQLIIIITYWINN